VLARADSAPDFSILDGLLKKNVDAKGNVTAPFASQGMKRGLASSVGLREVKTF